VVLMVYYCKKCFRFYSFMN